MSRSMAQRMQDDEDHRQALCGLAPAVRSEHELEDFAVRAHDFQIFASGRRDPAPTVRSGAKTWEGASTGVHVLAPPPLSKT